MNEETMIPGTQGMTVNESMKADLLSAARWMKFLCIIGCIGVVFLVLFGIFVLTIGSGLGIDLIPPFGAAVGIIYMIIAAIYIYPLVKGFQFANATKAACLTDDEDKLARGFEGLRLLLQFLGVLTIIVLAPYVLLFLGAFFIALIK